MAAKLFLIIGSLNAGLCVILGAFAAHGLKAKITEQSLSVFQTGVQYHFYHSFALLLVGVLMLQLQDTGGVNAFKVSGIAFIVGIVLFSGSLYGLSLSQMKWLGPITPLGGLAFIVAWFSLAFALVKS